jgi:hypothetical protein
VRISPRNHSRGVSDASSSDDGDDCDGNNSDGAVRKINVTRRASAASAAGSDAHGEGRTLSDSDGDRDDGGATYTGAYSSRHK